MTGDTTYSVGVRTSLVDLRKVTGASLAGICYRNKQAILLNDTLITRDVAALVLGDGTIGRDMSLLLLLCVVIGVVLVI